MVTFLIQWDCPIVQLQSDWELKFQEQVLSAIPDNLKREIWNTSTYSSGVFKGSPSKYPLAHHPLPKPLQLDTLLETAGPHEDNTKCDNANI